MKSMKEEFYKMFLKGSINKAVFIGGWMGEMESQKKGVLL